MRALLYATALAALATATQATEVRAAEIQAPIPDAATPLSELIITASRSPRPADHVTQSVTVIDAEAIRQSQVVLVADLLATTPGLSVSRNGGPGGVTSLRIRGAEADHTVVLVDGIRLNDPSQPAGGYNFANLVAGDVSRIEVLRGPQSTLWGSQAIGGVVNIVTTQARSPLEGNASLEAGSMASRTARAALGGKQAGVSWRLAASRHETDGVSAFRGGREAISREAYPDLEAFYADVAAAQDAEKAVKALAARYRKIGKTLEVRHLSPDCGRMLERAGDLVKVKVAEDDPVYLVARIPGQAEISNVVNESA